MGLCWGWLLLVVLILLEASISSRVASATTKIQYFRTNSTLRDKDLAVATHQLSLEAKAMSSTSCAMFCLSHGANCTEFSIYKPATGFATCKIGKNNASATVSASGVDVYIVGPPKKNLFESCWMSTQCPTNANCSDGLCVCISGLEAFNGNEDDCTAKIPPVDASGFQHYFDGFAYKRVPGGATSLSGATTSCSGTGAALPIPYGVPGVGVKALQALRTFSRPGEEFYVGLVATGTYSNRTFITSNGTLVDAKTKSADAAQFWAPNEPNAEADVDAAAVTMTKSGWQDIPSNTTVNTVLCSKWSGYEYNNVSGKYYKMHLEWSTQANADLVCRSEGGHLAITYGAVGQNIIRYYSLYYGSSPQAIWIAGSDAAQEDLWTFPDGTILDARQKATDNRQHWGSGEPNGGQGENCLYAWGDAAGWAYWVEVTCSYELGASLCERTF